MGEMGPGDEKSAVRSNYRSAYTQTLYTEALTNKKHARIARKKNAIVHLCMNVIKVTTDFV